ncbi:uncharacterized protein [Rutidosis leptorrhynchoides]|uniref:uncharacterized protein n=1 Tax=Rutidosis leptorrhynchoides TaxID=125765 RepID=UPI003A99DEFF
MPPPNTEEFDMFNYGVENVCKIKEGDHPFEISVVASSDSDGEKDGDEDEDEEDQYEEEKQDLFWNMPPLLSQREIHNPGSVSNLVTDKEDRFLMCYYSLGVVVRSFVQHCRPVIIVDGAHLKAGYSGTNLVAVAMDGNNGILPLAYGIGGELTFISDRAASIAHGVSTVFPEAFHCFCARHLFGSIKTKSNKFKYFEWHYWKMVKAYRGSDFEDHLSVFRRRLRASYNYLEQVGKRTRKSRRWQAIPSTNNLIEVRDGRKNGMVNLDDKVCSCGQWQLSGIPCEWSYPSPGVLQIVNPPIKEKRAPGRPKSTKRIPSKGEDTEKIVRTCTRCKEPGHGRDTCTASYDRTGESTSKRVVKTSAPKSKKGKEKATDAEAFKAYQSQFYATCNLGSDN